MNILQFGLRLLETGGERKLLRSQAKRIVDLEEVLAEFVRLEADPFRVGDKKPLLTRARRLLRKDISVP
jgi:hypothetical protein